MDATEDQIIAFADLALDCVKSPGPRRPDMKEVVRRLSTMIAELKALQGESYSTMSGVSLGTNFDTSTTGSSMSSMTAASRTGTGTGVFSGTGSSAVMRSSTQTGLESASVAEESQQLSLEAELELVGLEIYE